MAYTFTSGYLYGGSSVVTTSGGNIYCFYINSDRNGISMWKSTNGGTSFGQTTITASTITGNGSDWLMGLAVAIDSSGYIHVVVQSAYAASTRQTAYNLLNTSNDSWGTWEEALPNGTDHLTNYGCDIALDSNGKPHVLGYVTESSMGTDYDRIYYTNKVGASWLTPEMVSTATTVTHANPRITVRNSDIIEAHYLRTSSSTYNRTRTSGSWGTENQFGNYPNTKVLSTTGGTVYRYTCGSSDHKLYENGSDTGIGAIITVSSSFNFVSTAMIGTARYVFFSEYPTVYHKQVAINAGSGWSVIEIRASSTYELIPEWAYNFEYQNNRINYIYNTASPGTVYFDFYQSIVTSSKYAYTRGGTVVTDSNPAYICGQGNKSLATRMLFRVPTQSGTPWTGSTTAYIHGAVVTTDSQPVFMLAIEDMISPDGYIGSSGTWENELDQTNNIYTSIDELPGASDTDYIHKDGPSTTDYIEFTLSNLIGEVDNDYDVLLLFRARSRSGTIQVTVQLREDTTVIASKVQSLTTNFTTYYLQLSPAEKASITNWDNLRIRIVEVTG